jgi:hypothetical protein
MHRLLVCLLCAPPLLGAHRDLLAYVNPLIETQQQAEQQQAPVLFLAEELKRSGLTAVCASVETVYEDEAQVPLAMPPTLAVFLDLFRSENSIPDAIAAFRNCFSPARSAFRALERDFTSAASLLERLKSSVGFATWRNSWRVAIRKPPPSSNLSLVLPQKY